MGYLPEPLKDQVKTVMKGAYRLPAEEGMKRLKDQARWLQPDHPDAARSLLEGLEETFTINRLGCRPSCAAAGDDQPHREPALGGAAADAAGDELAGRGHGAAEASFRRAGRPGRSWRRKPTSAASAATANCGC
jgi:hypothetical protein